MENGAPQLVARDLRRSFRMGPRRIEVLRGISMEVQRSEAVDGVLGPVTRAAIEDYQVENNLPVTGAIDRPLLVSLGFIY